MPAVLAVVLGGGTMLITSMSPAGERRGDPEERRGSGRRPGHDGSDLPHDLNHDDPSNQVKRWCADRSEPGAVVWGGARVRHETRMPDFSTLIVNDGVQAWGAIKLNRQTYAAPAGGVRFSDVPRLNPVAPEGTSIASLVAMLRQAGCGTAEARGEQTVAGRTHSSFQSRTLWPSGAATICRRLAVLRRVRHRPMPPRSRPSKL
jgi:hypothetical protein